MKAVIAVCFFSILAAFDPTIPVLHLPDYHNESTHDQFIQKLEKAASEVGFFALTGTGVDPALLDQAYEQMVAYFDQEFEKKMALKSPDGQRGYVPGESAKGEKRVDFKEFYHIGRQQYLEQHHFAENIWPDEPIGFKPAMQALYQAMDDCQLAIGGAIAEACQMDPSFINDMIREGDNLMRAIHYPKNPPADAIWAAAHTDLNLFTILPRSTARGLQVKNQNGEWIDVIVPDSAFIINCADMLENLTNGYFRSAQHRVVDSGTGGGRYSVVFFVHPRSFDRVDPLPHLVEKTGGVRKYANLNRLELLAERLIDLGLASRGLMEFFVNSGAIERLREVDRFSPKAEEALLKAGFVF